MTWSTRAASSTVRQIGPTRVLMPAWIMPSRLTSSCVGEMPTALAARAGLRIDAPVSSAIAHVTRFAATAEPEPELEPSGLRSVSYGLQNVPPNELRGIPEAYSPRFAFARMIAPAARSRATNVASSGARSFGVARVGARRAAHVVRVVLVLEREHDAVQRPDELARFRELARRGRRRPRAHRASRDRRRPRPSCCAPCARRSPIRARAAGRRFSVCSALIWPAFGIVLIGPRMPSGSSTQVPL